MACLLGLSPLGALVPGKGHAGQLTPDGLPSSFRHINLLAPDGGGRVMSRPNAANSTLGWQFATPSNQLLSADVKDVKLHVYDLPPALNEDLVACYAKDNSAYPWEDDKPHGTCDEGETSHGICGLHKAAETSQYSADIWLHKAMLQHPNQVKDPMDADIVFIPFYGQLSAMHVWKEPCSGMRHRDRVALLVKHLHNSEAFQKHGRKHVLALSHWDVRPIMNMTNPAVKPLRSLVDSSQMVLLSTDPYFFLFDYGEGWVAPPWETLGFDTCRTVVIPYVPQMKLTETVHPLHERGNLAYFKGNTNLSTCLDKDHDRGEPPAYCTLRSKMVHSLSDEKGFVMDSTDSNSEMTRKTYTVSDYTDGIRNSTFCLMPRGDTPSSRRMFDAIAGGCIPVIISDEIRLPFQHVLDWGNFTVRISEGEVSKNAKIVATTLNKITPKRIAALQKRLLEVRMSFVFGVGAPNSASFRAGDTAANVLSEVRASLNPNACKALDNYHRVMLS